MCHCYLSMYSSHNLKWTAIVTPFLPPASWNFTCKEQNNHMRDLYIESKSLASEGYLPSQLQEILTLVRECKYRHSHYVCLSKFLCFCATWPVGPHVLTSILSGTMCLQENIRMSRGKVFQCTSKNFYNSYSRNVFCRKYSEMAQLQ